MSPRQTTAAALLLAWSLFGLSASSAQRGAR